MWGHIVAATAAAFDHIAQHDNVKSHIEMEPRKTEYKSVGELAEQQLAVISFALLYPYAG